MKLTLAVFCLFLLVSLTISAKSKNAKKRYKSKKQKSEPFIIGGQYESIKDNPFVVALVILYERNPMQFCGATIISKYFAVTAAHCLYYPTIQNAISLGKVVLRGGATNIRGSTGYDHRIYGYKIHEDFNSTVYYNDIALIQVKDHLNNTFEQMIEYASADYTYPAEEAVVYGWGIVEAKGSLSEKLKSGKVTILNKCSEQSWIDDKDGWVCAVLAPGTSTCFGDNGGPVIQNNVLIGIVSWPESCGATNDVVYTKVGYYSNWILNSMNNFIPSVDQK